MLKKYLSYLGIFILALFSFYYTDKATEIVKRNDPIMKNINTEKSKYSVKAVNAIVSDDEIIPGINGISVNTNKSYKQMKKDNNYNTDMYVFEEVCPTISFINVYSKYIVSGNESRQQVALIFKIIDSSYLSDLINIFNNKNTVATLFVDGSVLEKNTDIMLELSHDGFELENLGYDVEYLDDKIVWTNNTLSSITNKNPKYCYTDYKVKEVLKLCSDYHMYTIKPNNIISNYPFITVKNNLSSGSIISFNLNNEVIKELPSIISYIKQKGYEIVTLDNLLSEDYNN